jgi:hypothetical protein
MMDNRSGCRITVAALLVLFSFPCVFGASPQIRPNEPRLYAAVFLVRGSVAGSNLGSYGGFVRDGHDTAWTKLNRSNAICFGLGYTRHGPQGQLYLAGGNGVHRSTDLGLTWKVLTGWRTEEILAVVPDPDDSMRIFAATPFGVFRSTDGGATWTQKNVGFARWYVQRLHLDPADRKTLYALVEDDIYCSHDGAETWIPLRSGVSLPVSFAQDPRDPRTMLLGSEEEGMRRSTDGGLTWSPVEELGGDPVYAIRFSADGSEVYAGGYGTGLWRSLDRGNSWSRVPFTVECEAITAISIDPADGNHVVIGTHASGVYESTDHGARWKFAGLRGAIVKQIEYYP